MKTYIKKAQALELLPQLYWAKVGTMMKKPKSVLPEVVGEHINEHRWRMYYVGGRYVVCSSKDHDKYFEAEKR